MGWDDGGNEPEEIGRMLHKHSTNKATLFITESGHELWVPHSVLLEAPDHGEQGEVVVKFWWADKNGH